MEVDRRVPGFLGRVLDRSGTPVGTCFQVAPGVLVTAWHVLDGLGAGDVDAIVRVDPLRGGQPRQAWVRRIDPVHDLAVLSAGEPLVECVMALAATDDVELDTRVSVTGVSDVEDPGHSYRYLHASGAWRGGTTRNDQVPLGRLRSADVVPGMSGAPVRRRDGVVIGVVSARYNSNDDWLRGTVWVARVENLTPLLDAVKLDDARTAPVRRRRLLVTVLVALVLLTLGGFFLRGQGPGADLLARVPEPLRSVCRATDAGGVPAAPTVLTCHDATGGPVVVSLLTDQRAVDDGYAEAVREAGIPRGSGDCAIATGAEHRYPSVGVPRGRVLCYARDGVATVVWTDDLAGTVARATASADDDQALQSSWASWMGVPSFPAVEEQALISLVEEGNCKRVAAGTLDRFRNVIAAVDCTSDQSGASTVSYYRFADLNSLQRSYDQHVADVRAPTGTFCGDGAAAGFLGNRRYDLRSVELGGLLCYPGPRSTLVMEWSVEPLLVLGQAVGADPEDLSGWWSRNYGPPTARIVEAVNAQAAPPFPDEQEKTLLEHIPLASRSNCLRPSPKQIKINVSTAPVVGVVCGPTSGAPIVFYYQFSDVASMNANYETIERPQGGDCATMPPNFNGESAYSRGEDSGRLLCASNEGGYRYLSWTNDRLKIQGFAFQGRDPLAMLNWWLYDAGPV